MLSSHRADGDEVRKAARGQADGAVNVVPVLDGSHELCSKFTEKTALLHHRTELELRDAGLDLSITLLEVVVFEYLSIKPSQMKRQHACVAVKCFSRGFLLPKSED